MIEEGRVEVNGELVRKLPAFVDPRTDQIVVDGRPITRPVGAGARKHYIILNKPERTLTTASDEPGMERRTVLDLIDHPAKPRLFAVGRLGWDETGLVLLTNDGELANRLTHPRYGVAKTYLAVVKGDVNEADLHRMTRQMFKLQRLASRQVGRLRSARVEMSVFKREPGKTTLRVVMKEGKNRYVADVLGTAGFPVRKVAAVSIGPLQLRGLSVGSWRELDRDEVRVLRNSCKERVAAAKNAMKARAPQSAVALGGPSAAHVPPAHRAVMASRAPVADISRRAPVRTGPQRQGLGQGRSGERRPAPQRSTPPSPRFAPGGRPSRKVRPPRQDER